MSDDLVGAGLVPSMARPGGNTTGVSIMGHELDVKRLEILHELAPEAHRIGVDDIGLEELLEFLALLLARRAPIGPEHEARDRRHVEAFLEEREEALLALRVVRFRGENVDRALAEIGDEAAGVVGAGGARRKHENENKGSSERSQGHDGGPCYWVRPGLPSGGCS